MLYWRIGREVLTRQAQAGWGAKVIDQRSFAEAWPEEPIVQQPAAQIPWFHNCVLLDKVKDDGQRLWYVQKTIENGWSRNVLVHQIDTKLFARQGRAPSNFAATLPAPQSDLAQQLLKDPYNFE